MSSEEPVQKNSAQDKDKSNAEIVNEIMRENFGDCTIKDDADTKTPEYSDEDCTEASEADAEEPTSDENIKLEDEEHLLSVEKDLTEEEIEDRYKKSLDLKQEGNRLFKLGSYDEAIKQYTDALQLCPTSKSKERAVLWANRGACHMSKKDFKASIADSTKALNLQPSYVKALLRRAKSYEETEKLEDALEDFKKILEIDPGIHEARAACMRLPGEITERNEKLKNEMMGKLKDLGNMVLRPFGLSTDNFQVQQNPDTGSYSVNFQQNAPRPPTNGK